jgi:hypothetical protein
MAQKLKRSSSGRFDSREELTCHVWSIQRQQVYPNARAIALACGVTLDAVRKIITSEEGLGTYLQHGCPTGGPSASSSNQAGAVRSL